MYAFALLMVFYKKANSTHREVFKGVGISFPIAALTNYHRLRKLKTTQMYHRIVPEVRSLNSVSLQERQTVGRAAVFLEALRGISLSLPFPASTRTCIPWPVAVPCISPTSCFHGHITSSGPPVSFS